MGTRRKYTESFKKDAVRLFTARGERSAKEVAEGLAVRPNQLYRWRQKYGSLPSDSEASAQSSEELAALRRRNRQLEMENALLKKAAAFFAKESL